MAELLQALLLDIPEAIETERLQLRATRAGEGERVNEAVLESHAALRPWMPWAKEPPTLERSEAYAREAHAKWLARETLDFTWYERAEGRLIGKGGLHTIEWAIPKFEIGYWVRTSAVGRGYATEATGALTRFAREHLGARRLEITSDVRNTASRRVAEKCGYELEGIRRLSRRDHDGRLSDSCLYARVFPE